MGYSMCSGIMSKQQIRNGEKVALFMLHPSDMRNYYLQPRTNLISNEGPEALYKVIGLPLVGVFDEVRLIIDIEKNDFTAAMEEYLGVKIEDFINHIMHDYEKLESDKAMEVASKISICMEHHSIFEKMIQIDAQKNTCEKSDLYYTTLEKIGFERVGESSDERYSSKYEHPDYPSLVIFSDGTFARLFDNGKEIQRIYNLKDLLDYMKMDFDTSITNTSLFLEWVRDYTKDVIKIEYSEEEESRMMDIFKKIQALGQTEEDKSKIKEYLEELKKENESKQPTGFSEEDKKENDRKLQLLNSLGGTFKNICGKEMFYFSNEDLAKNRHFLASMWATGSLFMPTYSSYNDTEPDYDKELFDFVTEFRKENR